jgi:hypothetical protein
MKSPNRPTLSAAIGRPRLRIVGLAIVGVLGLAGLSSVGPAQTGPKSAAPALQLNSRLAAGGQVTAHDGQFWRNNQPLVLHGINMDAAHPGLSAFTQQVTTVASWGMNTVRLHVSWTELELIAPQQNHNGTWSHTYDQAYLTRIKADIAAITSAGMQTVVDSTGDTNFFSYPDWLYTAQYNSGHIDYPATDQGLLDAQTDFWSDDLRQQFHAAFWGELAGDLQSVTGVAGYEVMNEPQAGALDNGLPTTQLILDSQLSTARVIRAKDPDRVIFFMTHDGYGPGLPHADLSGWIDPSKLSQPLGIPDVAVDVHDYFGGRWGSGLQRDPALPDYLESRQDLYGLTLADPPTPYIGTTEGQVRWIRDKLDAVIPLGIPLFVGEFGCPNTDPGAELFFGTTTSALNSVWASWAVSRGQLGIMGLDGSLEPYAGIVIAAAGKYS